MPAQTARTPGNGTGTLAYTLTSDSFDVETVYVSVDATGAAGPVTAELTITDQSGVVIARKPQTVTIDVGASGSATWGLRLDGDGAGSGGGYSTVEDEGSALTQRTILNFTGAGVTATDDGGFARTDVDVPGASSVTSVWVAPIFGLLPCAVIGSGTNTIYGIRYIVPNTGTIEEMAVYVGTASGNIDVGIYDTSSTTRNRLYHSGNVALGASSNQWVTIGTAGLAVTSGDQIDLCWAVDNNVATLAFITIGAGNNFAGELPAGFLAAPGGARRYMSWFSAGPGGIPATLSEAAMFPWASAACLLTRIQA